MDKLSFQRNQNMFITNTPLIKSKSPAERIEKIDRSLDFQSMLQQKIQGGSEKLTFSKHAMQRIDQRKIELTPQLVEQLSSAIQSAEQKGIQNALVLREQTAFIVNVSSKTVVTTMENTDMKNNIITNIDGAVII